MKRKGATLLKPSLITDMSTVRDRIVGVKQRVPLLNGETRTYINFDNAASTPALSDVLDTVNTFMAWYASVHRGTGFKSRVATQAYDDAREIVSKFAGANAGLRENPVVGFVWFRCCFDDAFHLIQRQEPFVE